ncbi:MAG: ATP-dependent Clp protease ATP-binding subunit ClpX, partial [Geminicoccaceae bacterium]
EMILLDTMFDLPGLDGVEEVVVNKEAADGHAAPIRVYAERKEDRDAAG